MKQPKVLQVNENYRITSDEICFTVEERKVGGEKAKNPGGEYWKSISFHPNIIQAFESVCDQVSLNLFPDLKAIVEEITEIKKALTENLKP